ncbi:uncharacterized protein LOC123534679 isoform X2 [Mercenaria mercenaria]|nr:uncharacterized protein LOC123534679 isoform X2 [Mercenaria mercenaria]
MTDEHIAYAVGAIQCSDAQKMGFMVKVIKRIQDTLAVMDTRIQGRFDETENQMDYTMSQLNQSVRQLREVVERVDETCSKITENDIGESKDDETQTDIVPAVPFNMTSDENKPFHRNSTQEFTLSQEEIEYPDLTDVETNQVFAETDDRSKSYNRKGARVFSNRKMGGEFVTAKEDMNDITSDKFFETTTFIQHTGNKTVLPWKIEPTDWLLCVNDGDKQMAEDLLKERKLPDQELLDKACIVFGRTSPIVSAICSSICSYMREKSSESIIDIWPAYEYSKLCADTDKNKIIFVVIKENQNDLGLGDVYITYEREAFNCSSESSEINKLEYDTDLAAEDLADLTNCVSENSVSLMGVHSNLTMVSASCKTSKGFNTSARTIQNKPTVVLYTHVKGLIPLKEEPFPEQIGQYFVDVREAVFKLFLGGRPNEYHENLRMGCAIRNSKIDQLRNCSAGTLGGFPEHPHYGLCCITCAHVLCDDLNNFQHCQNGVRHWTGNDQPKEVFQPCCFGSPLFGHLVCAIYNQGGFGKAGVDVALIKIDSRDPVDGYFCQTQKKVTRQGFQQTDQ